MYCHIHHCHYHHCHCVPKDSKEKGGALTQEELLVLLQEMKDELKDYTVDLKDQIFSYIDIGVNPVEIANTFASLKEQDTYILRTLTNKIDELNNTTNLSMFNLRTRVTDLEGQSATIINDLAELENDLANPDKGAAMVAYNEGSVVDALERVDPRADGQPSEELRWVKGVPAYVKSKDAYLNDRADIDPTGSQDIGEQINTYLLEYQDAGFTHVYMDGGSVYKTSHTIEVPPMMVIEGVGWKNQKDGTPNSERHRTMIKAASDNMVLIKLNKYSRAIGLYIDLDNHVGSVGVQPGSHCEIAGCLFGHVPVGSWGIRGGGILYLHVHDNMFSDVHPGTPIELKQANSPLGTGSYYGVNVGTIERNRFFSQGGSVIEGIFTITENNFEGGMLVPALTLSRETGSTQYGILRDNYFEHSSGVSQSVLIGDQWRGVIQGNHFYGTNPAAAGGYAIRFEGAPNAFDISGNNIARFETGIDYLNPIGSNGQSAILAGNNFAICETNISGIDTRATPDINRSPVYAPEHSVGHRFLSGAMIGSVVRYKDRDGDTLDLTKGSVFDLSYASPVTLKRAGHLPGMRFAIYFETGNITLSNSAWNLKSGESETPPVGSTKDFIVTYNGMVREV